MLPFPWPLIFVMRQLSRPVDSLLWDDDALSGSDLTCSQSHAGRFLRVIQESVPEHQASSNVHYIVGDCLRHACPIGIP